MADPERAGTTRLDVLLAAHNGERFIAEQIESVLRQSDTDWFLRIRDDCSTDATLAIALDYARRHPDRISVEQRHENSGSARQNFLEMLSASRAPFVMFCDHDDVWHEDKIALTRAKMQTLEAEWGADVPLLVHTDLVVTDAALRVVAPSMMRAQQLDGSQSRLPRLLAQNVVTGCTVMVNRPLIDLADEPYDDVVMHDWWLALIAAAFGHIGFVDVPTVLYRQHGANVVGARPSRSPAYKIGRLLDRRGVTRSLRDSVAQAAAFLSHFGARLEPEQVEMLQAFASIPQLGKPARIAVLRRHDLWKNTLVRRVGQLLYV